MKNANVVSLRCTALAALLASAAVHAQLATDHTTCRSGTVTVLAQADKMIVYSLDHRGVAQGSNSSDPYHGSTQRCVGVVASFDGKVSGSGWCKQVHPQTGDWLVLDWASSGMPGSGTYTLRHGTGKWKDVTGGGTYESLAPTRPVDAGTYQNCIRIKGNITIPG